jgi:hypothetical protein
MTDPYQVISVKPYRIPEIHKEEIQRQSEQILCNDIITSSKSSPWNSLILVVPKKADASGKMKWRIMVDLRKLSVIQLVIASLRVISDVLDTLNCAS